MKRVVPQNNCLNHRIIEKDVVVYGYRVFVRWSGEDFGDCNDVLFLPEKLEYMVYFAPSERLPVIVSVLYSKPDIVENVRAFVVDDVRRFAECLFNNAELLARDVVALNIVPKVKEVLEKYEKDVGPVYRVDVDSVYGDLLDLCNKLCRRSADPVEAVAIGPEIESLKRKDNIIYGAFGSLVYLNDGVNSVFIDIRSIDPFEIGEEYILIVYGVYEGGKELAYATYLGETEPNSEIFEVFLDKHLANVLREDGRLKSPMSIAKVLHEVIEEAEESEQSE